MNPFTPFSCLLFSLVTSSFAFKTLVLGPLTGLGHPCSTRMGFAIRQSSGSVIQVHTSHSPSY